MAAMAERLVLAFLLAVAAVQAASAVDTKLTLHNLCNFTVYPLVTANRNFPSITDNTGQLPRNGLVSFPFPATSWAGRVVARTFCRSLTNCATGTSPPMTVVQLVVHSTEAGPGDREDLATYSVSLAEGFNVGAVVSPLLSGGGQCQPVGCPANLTNGCPVDQLVIDDCDFPVACKGDPGYFKQRCPLARVNDSEHEPVPQNCLAPREIKVVFCPTELVVRADDLTMVGAASAQTELVVHDI